MAAEWKGMEFNGAILDTIKPVIKALDNGLTVVLKVVTALTKVLKIIQLFISSFSSIMSVLQTFITLGRQTIKDTLGKLDAGIFVNVLVPPAFVQALSNNLDWTNMSDGGYPGFISRVGVSLNNTADVNRPVFDSEGIVGGLIFLIDAETLDDFFKALDFIKNTFDFMDFFPFITEPPPPRNIRTTSGYFQQPDGSSKYGIRIEWEAPSIIGFESYKISRSTVPGGSFEEQEVIPTKLVGPKGHEEEGILTGFKIRRARTKPIEKDFTNPALYQKALKEYRQWPLKMAQVYRDDPSDNPKFGGPYYVEPNFIDYSGVFIDYNVHLGKEITYYYVVQSGTETGNKFGPYSAEAAITSIPQGCIPAGASDVVEHPSGLELLSVGVGPLGMWTSVTAKQLLPFLPVIIEYLLSFLDTLEGGLKTSNKAFIDFLQGIVDKFDTLLTQLQALTDMIIALENFFSSIPKIAMLLVPTEKGGVDGFMSRVSGATPPPGGLSGPSGISAGVVFIWGASTFDPKRTGAQWSDAEKAANTAIVGAAMSLITEILSS